jgi:hypothetical protein
MGPQIEEAQLRNKAHDSLYRGTSNEKLSGVAPYLFQFAHPTPFSNWFLKSGWGDSWGLMVKSSWPLPELHKHFRKFLMVQTEDGQELYFRFYDPRVLRIFLPTCDAVQIRELFGEAIDAFVMEDEDPAFALRFRHENGILKTERFPVADIIAALPEPEPLPPPAEDPLPPETIAYMKEHGLLPAEEPPATPAITFADTAPAQELPQPQPQKPKSKWNMFD